MSCVCIVLPFKPDSAVGSVPTLFLPVVLRQRKATKQSAEYRRNASQALVNPALPGHLPLKRITIGHRGSPMHSIAAALIGIALAAGASYAHGDQTEASGQNVGQVAGTLTCVTKPELSLVFGRNPVADCSFVAERGGARQQYQALLPATTSAAEVETVQRIVWRVRTPDGASRPDMLKGAFLSVAAHLDREQRTLAGRSASLEILSHSRRSVGAFARSHARLDLAPIEDGREG